MTTKIIPGVTYNFGDVEGLALGRSTWLADSHYHPAWDVFWKKEKTLIGPVSRPVPPAALAVVHARETAGAMGSDPEFFVERGGFRVPAFEVLKHKSQSDIFWDGFQAETLVQPRHCHQRLFDSIARQLRKLRMLYGLEVSPGCVWRVPNELLERSDEEHVALGCDPSFNIYSMRGREVQNPRDLKYRFAGGHIHFALPRRYRTKVAIERIVKALDCWCGLPSVCLAQNYDRQIRRVYYGLAGEFRLPSHGIEYRTLSNFWLMHPSIYHLVFDLARLAFAIGRSGLNRAFIGRQEQVIETINYGDVRTAKLLMRQNAEYFDGWHSDHYGGVKTVAFWKALEEGFEAVIKSEESIIDNWVKPSPYFEWRRACA